MARHAAPNAATSLVTQTRSRNGASRTGHAAPVSYYRPAAAEAPPRAAPRLEACGGGPSAADCVWPNAGESIASSCPGRLSYYAPPRVAAPAAEDGRGDSTRRAVRAASLPPPRASSHVGGDGGYGGCGDEVPKTFSELARLREQRLRRSSGVSTWVCRTHNRRLMEATGADETLDVFEKFGAGFDGCNLSTALSRVAKFVEAGEAFDAARLAPLRSATRERVQEFALRHACSVVWSLGKLGLRDVPLLEAVAGLVTRRFRDLSPKDLGIASWGFAANRYRHTPVLSAIGAMAVEQHELFEPTELANVVWGFATLQFRQGQVMARLAAACTASASRYQTRELASVLWSYSSLSYRDDHHTRTDSPLFTRVGGLLAERVSDFDPQGLTNLVWSYANIMHQAPEELLNRCCVRFQAIWVTLKPQEIANAIWAYERLGNEAFARLAGLRLETGKACDFALWSGEQLLKLVECLQTQAPGTRAQLAASAVFEARFLGPVRCFLGTLSPDISFESYAQRLRSFGLFHLGPRLTLRVLGELGLAFEDRLEEAAFAQGARPDLLRHYLGTEEVPGLAVKEPAMLNGGQTCSRWVAALVSYELRGPLGARAGRRVVGAGHIPRQARVLADFGALRGEREAAEADAEVAELGPGSRDATDGGGDGGDQGVADAAEAWLWSVKFAGDVGRSSHCEFVALAELVVDSELRAVGLAGPPRVAPDFGGAVCLFTTHYPCLSCVGLLAQFRQRFPRIHVKIACMEWRCWQQELRDASSSRAPG